MTIYNLVSWAFAVGATSSARCAAFALPENWDRIKDLIREKAARAGIPLEVSPDEILFPATGATIKLLRPEPGQGIGVKAVYLDELTDFDPKTGACEV